MSGDLADHDVNLVRAGNPGPLTLTGTNTWIAGRWVIDPGPALDAHLDAVAAAVGAAEGIAVTHDHADHAEGLDALRSRLGDVPVVSARGGAADGDVYGPLRVLGLPGHSDDHLAFVFGRAAFVGDAVLGEGSVFVTADLAGYLDGLRRLRELDLAVLCPGHGEPIWDVRGSSTATSSTGSNASGACSPPSSRGCGARTSCSTRRGTTRRPSCGRSPLSRCGRIWRSCGPRGGPERTSTALGREARKPARGDPPPPAPPHPPPRP